jgi:Tfp pilus assembly protein PilF
MTRREKLEALLQDDPDDSFLRYAVAMEHKSEGEPAKALETLQEVLERDPQYVAAYFQAAQLLAEANQTDPARDLLRHGILVAERAGDSHAAGEMQGLLMQLGGP